MKRTFLALLLLIVLVCAKQGYEVFLREAPLQKHFSGSLSDVSEEVIAIPLKTAEGERIEKARNIRQEGKNLFLVSRATLYRFNRKGEFICRITDPEEIRVAGYVLNPAQRQLIVLGNTDDIYYYSYEGKLLDKKKLKSDLPDRKMFSASMYQNHIWSIEEKLTQPDDTAPKTSCLERVVVKYDTSFHPLETRKLLHADLGRTQYAPSCFAPQLSVTKNTGELYAYEPSMQPEELVRDTLYLRSKRKKENPAHLSDNPVYLYPLRFGKRMWVSTYTNKTNANDNYTFCYDTLNNRYWHVQGGLKDNFYHTGEVQRLEAIDLFADTYCFCKSGKEIKEAFPKLADEGNTVLFIVKLKS